MVENKLAAKAVYQSSDLLVMNFQKLSDNLSKSQAMLYKPAVQDVTVFHSKDRSHLFISESTTAVTPDGQIFVLGGKYKCTYIKSNIELVVDFNVNSHPQSSQILASKKLPISFRYLKNVGHYFILPRRDMF